MAGFEDRDAWGPGASRRAPCACRRGAKTEGSVTTTRRWGGKAVNRCRWPYFAIGSKRSMARRLPPGSPALFLPLPWSTREAQPDSSMELGACTSERMPLEAVLCGATLVTSNTSSNCALGKDFALSASSYVHNADELVAAVGHRHPQPAAMAGLRASLFGAS